MGNGWARNKKQWCESAYRGPVWGSRQHEMGWIGYKFLNLVAWVRILVLRVRRYRHTELMILRKLQRSGQWYRLSLMEGSGVDMVGPTLPGSTS